MTWTPPSTADLLCQAEAALHAVLIGRQSVEVVVEGRVVKYGPANITSSAPTSPGFGAARSRPSGLNPLKGLGDHYR